MSNFIMVLFVLIAVTSRQSFVDSAPLNDGAFQESAGTQDVSVKELESLKRPLETFQLSKSETTYFKSSNGQREEHTERKQEVNENGKLLARVNQHIDVEPKGSDAKPVAKMQTDVEVPSKGIHKSVIQQLPAEYQTLTENGNRRSSAEPENNVDTTFTGIQYSPLDMAEYVFWTGDEKGVSLAIEDFLQEGLMTKEEAISFLQEIKYNLDYLKGHYTQLGLNGKERIEDPSRYPLYSKSGTKPGLRTNSDINQLRQEMVKKREPEIAHSKTVTKITDSGQDEDYEELLERLRLADFLYTEYSLEEVIYQLAKVMFTQSLTHGSAEAQQALNKFTNFLETEAEQGHISRTLEKKVLDVLIASLSDTLTEHPELISAARETLRPTSSNAEGQHFLRQILEISPGDKAAVRTALDPFKQQTERNIQIPEQIKEIKMANHVPLGLGKYKNT